MADTNVTDILLAGLRRQRERYPKELHDIEVALAALELPRAFRLMEALKERGLWQPTPGRSRGARGFLVGVRAVAARPR